MAMILDRCPWYLAGPLLGVLIVGLRAFLNKPFGAVGGYIDVVEHVRTPSRLGVSAYLLAGLVIGGMLLAAITGRFVPTLEYEDAGGLFGAISVAQVGLLVVAGAAIGFGARMAGGCTSGHGLSGTSHGSPASFVAAMTFFGTAVVLAHMFAWLRGGLR